MPSPLLGLRDELTLAFWIRGSGENGNWQWPVSRATTTTGRSYGFYIGKTTGILTFSGAFEAFPDRGHMDFPTGLNVWDDTWHHVVAVYSAATGQLQITIDGAASGGYAVNGGRLRDCGEPVSFGHVFPGKLDEVLLYSRCLTAEEAAGLSRREPPEMKGLVGWWPFDDANDPGRDRGPNGLDATTRTPTFDTVKRAREHGLRVLGILGFPPAWASSAPEDAVRPWVYKPDLQAWSHHVEEVTRHFKGTVDHWEIWNEPNISVFWEPDPDPREFIDVVRTGYAAAKRGNPECTVITPGLAGPGHNRHGMAFIEELLDLGAARHCDAISIHPYRQDTPEESDLVGDLKHIVAKAEANGGRRTLWATEWCWTTQIGGGSTERRSARMLARGVSLALGTGLMDRIIWFRLHDPGTDRFYSEHNYGLCHNDLTPKPAYFALRTCARLLDGATPVPGGERSGPGVWSRVFERDGRHAMALWRTEGESVVSVSSNEPGLNVTDIMGNCRRVPVEGGIAFVSTSEDAVFVEGVAAAGPVELVVATCPEAVRPGELVELLLKTRNPGKTERNAAVSVSIPSFGFDWSADLPMPPAGDQERRVPLRVPMNALPGVTSVAVVVRLGGHRWQENPTLRVTNIDRGSGPVGVWRFDEGEGEVAHDASGHGNHGVISGCRWVAGRHGTALAFAGGGSRDVGGGDGGDPSVDDVVSVPDTADLDLLEEATLAFWLKLTGDTGTWQFPVTKFLSNQSRNYGVYIRSSDFHVAMSTSLEGASYPHSDVAGRVAVNDGNWHHIAAVFDTTAGEMRLYIDGEEDGRRRADEGLLKTNDEPLRIGAGTHGVIDDVTLYARALPSGEIRSILSGNVGKLVP